MIVVRPVTEEERAKLSAFEDFIGSLDLDLEQGDAPHAASIVLERHFRYDQSIATPLIFGGVVSFYRPVNYKFTLRK